MPNPPAPQSLERVLAQRVLDSSLGSWDVQPTLEGFDEVGDKDLQQWQAKKPPSQEFHSFSPQDLLHQLLSRFPGTPNGEWLPLTNPSVIQGLKQVKDAHPLATSRYMKNVKVGPLDAGQAGGVGEGSIKIDPAETVNMFKDEAPDDAMANVIRHELSHLMGYSDDYDSQPVINGRYGRRPLDEYARDAQDIDHASHILHKTVPH